MFGFLIYAGICAVVVGFLGIRRISEKGVLVRRPARPAPPVPLTDSLAGLQRDYAQKRQEVINLRLPYEDESRILEHVHNVYVWEVQKRIDAKGVQEGDQQ